MKRFAIVAFVVGLVAATAAAKPVSSPAVHMPASQPASPVVTLRLDQIIAGATTIKADNRQLEDGLADANRKVITVDQKWRKAYDDQGQGYEKKLAQYDHWYVRAVLFCAGFIKWLIVLYLALSVFVIVASRLNPVSLPFQIGAKIYSTLHILAWTKFFAPKASS